ncbi:MAG: outer membrane lipoprotein-sorting protein, partial [Deltaproteobacteria bacterium]|nr:outer membrane lipoprotein-sorting protein [Deltaproteobacteria bacterium]
EDQNSGYEKVVSYVDKEKCVALKVEFFEKGGKLRKLLEVDVGKITLEGGIHVPTAVSMTDLRDDTTTVLLVNEIDMHAKIPRSRFSQRRLETGR